jgi:hypothetical protein
MIPVELVFILLIAAFIAGYSSRALISKVHRAMAGRRDRHIDWDVGSESFSHIPTASSVFPPPPYGPSSGKSFKLGEIVAVSAASAGVATLTALAAVGLATAPVRAEQPSAPLLKAHPPIDVKRRDDGSLVRGTHNEFVTSNWSGYAIGDYQTATKYTSAQATWVVPSVTFGETKPGAAEEYSATWVGIGGFCMNAMCTKVDQTLIQLGTSQYVSSSGSTSYFAWYEMLPRYPVNIGLAVGPGNKITASLQCVSACSARRQSWKLSMTNNSTGEAWSQTFIYSSSLASADWIEEAPYSGGVLPLANFNVVGIAPYFGAGNSATPASLSLSANGIQMSDPSGQTSNPSSTDANGFNVCWSYGSMMNCSPP